MAGLEAVTVAVVMEEAEEEVVEVKEAAWLAAAPEVEEKEVAAEKEEVKAEEETVEEKVEVSAAATVEDA